MRTNLVTKLNRKLFNLKFYGGVTVCGFAGTTLTYIALHNGEDKKKDQKMDLLEDSEKALIEIADQRQAELQEQHLKLLEMEREIKVLKETNQALEEWLNIYKNLMKQKNEKQASLESELFGKTIHIEELKQKIKDQEDLLENLKRNYKQMEAKYKAAYNNFKHTFETNIRLVQHVKDNYEIDLPKEVSFLVPSGKVQR